MRYINADPDGHFNSSTATLTMPAGARVVRAYLYWGADLARGVDNRNDAADGAPGGEIPDDPATPGSNPGTNTKWTTAKLRVGSRPYVTVDATDPARDGQWSGVASWYSQPGNRPGFAYQVRANVTQEIRDAAARARRRRTRTGREPEAADRHRRRRAGRPGLQPARRLDAAGGVGDADERVAEPHPLRRVRVRAGLRRPAARRRPARLHRVPDAGERRRRRPRRHLDVRRRPRDHQGLSGARPQHRQLPATSNA